MVFGEVFIGVASRVRDPLGSLFGFVAGELTAVGDDYIFLGLVTTLSGEILDLADDGFAGENFAEDDVLPIEVRGWDRGDKELGAIGPSRYRLA